MHSGQIKKVKLEKKNLKIALCFEIIFLFFVDCEQFLFSQSSLSLAGLERAKWPRGKLEVPLRLGFLFFLARFARFPCSRDHPEGLLAVYIFCRLIFASD